MWSSTETCARAILRFLNDSAPNGQEINARVLRRRTWATVGLFEQTEPGIYERALTLLVRCRLIVMTKKSAKVGRYGGFVGRHALMVRLAETNCSPTPPLQ